MTSTINTLDLLEFNQSTTEENEGFSPWLPIQDIDRPVLLLSPPLGLSTDIPNNAWMEKMSPEDRKVNLPRALEEFHGFVNKLSKDALVFLLPPYPGLQDLVYVANLGLVPTHAPETVILSNFKSEPRRGEDIIGANFLSQLGYRVIKAPYYFEGEADFKHIRDNVYVGAHGMRTSIKFLKWFEETFDAHVIPFEMTDPLCYHLDGCVLPLREDKVAVCVDVVGANTIKEIEKFAEIIPISQIDAQSGALNSVLVSNKIYSDTIIDSLSKYTERYDRELSKIKAVEKMAKFANFDPNFVYMSEFEKSGAALSCLVMNLNWKNK